MFGDTQKPQLSDAPPPLPILITRARMFALSYLLLDVRGEFRRKNEKDF